VILVDTSVWVEHLRCCLPRLAALLQEWKVLELLQGLPAAVVASDSEVLLLIEQDQLMGRGIGTVDAHLLTSAKLSHCQLWTQDRRLAAPAKERGLAVLEPGVE
jgi:predicted nucleic acid-binding protein